jgi:hypothetical protein
MPRHHARFLPTVSTPLFLCCGWGTRRDWWLLKEVDETAVSRIGPRSASISVGGGDGGGGGVGTRNGNGGSGSGLPTLTLAQLVHHLMAKFKNACLNRLAKVRRAGCLQALPFWDHQCSNCNTAPPVLLRLLLRPPPSPPPPDEIDVVVYASGEHHPKGGRMSSPTSAVSSCMMTCWSSTSVWENECFRAWACLSVC